MKQNAHGSWYPGRKHPERCRVQRALRGLMAQLIVGITVVTAASARGEEPDVMWFWCEHVWCLGSMLTRAEAEAARTEKVQSSYSRPILWMKRPKGVPCRKSPLDAKGCVIEARTAPAPVAIMRPEDIWLLLTEDQKALSAKGKSITLSPDRVGSRAWDIATRRRTASDSLPNPSEAGRIGGPSLGWTLRCPTPNPYIWSVSYPARDGCRLAHAAFIAATSPSNGGSMLLPEILRMCECVEVQTAP